MSRATDDELIVYAEDHGATVVTTNKDFIPVARRLRSASVIYLKVDEDRAGEALLRALDWLSANRLPQGRVLRVPLRAPLRLLSPLPW